jgi:hypothetical protein
MFTPGDYSTVQPLLQGWQKDAADILEREENCPPEYVKRQFGRRDLRVIGP